MPFLALLVLNCTLVGYKPMPEKTLEETHKGERHNLSKLIQEQQGEVECYV